MASSINPNNIDGAYPVAGQDNSSQGFRDNFTNIKTNFQYAEDEINDLQTKSLLKAALVGQTLDNNMNDNLIYAAAIRDFAAPKTAVTPAGSPLTATINYATSHYQTFSTTASTKIVITNLPATGNYGYVKVQINVTNTAHTITIQGNSAGALLGTTGIQGYVAANAYTGTITFQSTGYYEFAFGSYDSGLNITVFDLNRALTNFTSADISTDDLTATGTITAAGNISGGNIYTAGLVSSTGNVIGGNVSTGGLITATGNITGGNIVTTGTVSTTGNVNGLYTNGFSRPTAGTTTQPSIRMTAGTLTVTPATGAIEYDGTVMYSTLGTNQRSVMPTEIFTCLYSDYTGTNSGSAQQVFNASTNGEVTVLGSMTYMFEATYYITRSAGTTSHTLSTLFGGTATFTSVTYTAESTSTTGNALGAVSRIYGTGISGVTVTAANTSATENITVTLRGVMRTNAGGTIIPQIQYSTAPGGAPTILKNSFFKMTPIGTSSVTTAGVWS